MKNLHLVLIAGILFTVGGCVEHHHGNGDITFSSTFYLPPPDNADFPCNDQYVDVRTINFDIYDVTGGIRSLEDSGSYSCGSEPITRYNFVPGDYEIDLTGTSSYDGYNFSGSSSGPIYAGSDDVGTIELR